MEVHLSECPSCTEELAFLKRIQTAIGRKPVTHSPGLWNDIEKQLAEGEGAWSQFEWAGKRIVPILAAAVLFIAVWGNIDGNGSISLEGYLQSELDESEVALLSDADLSADDVVYMIHER